MPMIDALLKRRSVLARNMTAPGPSDSDLEKILQAGIRVPDHGKLAPWRIRLVRGNAQARLGDLYADIFARENPTFDAKLVEVERQRPQRAPVMLTVISCVSPEHKIPDFEQLMSAGAVCTTLLYAAQTMGYAAQWLTEWPAYHPDVAAAFGCGRHDRIVGFIYIGTPTEAPTERPRPDLADIVSDWTGPDPGAASASAA